MVIYEGSNTTIVSSNSLNFLYIENAPPELLAWCPYDSNIINIVEIEKQQSYASFEGVKIINMGKSQILQLSSS